MEENVRNNSVVENPIQNNDYFPKDNRTFRLLKMNMDDKQVELVLRIKQLYGNQFKAEYEEEMVTIKTISKHIKPRMTSRTFLLPCSVDQDSMQTELNGDKLTIRFERNSEEDYLFDWQALKDLNTMKN